MKKILALSILFSVVAWFPALGELTDADLNEIRLIVKDEIAASETRMKEHINTQIESVDKRLSLVTTLTVGLIALIVLAVGIPQILMARQSLKDNNPQIEEFTQKLILQIVRGPMTELMTELVTELVTKHAGEQEEKIESLTQEIETLKQHS